MVRINFINRPELQAAYEFFIEDSKEIKVPLYRAKGDYQNVKVIVHGGKPLEKILSCMKGFSSELILDYEGLFDHVLSPPYRLPEKPTREDYRERAFSYTRRIGNFEAIRTLKDKKLNAKVIIENEHSVSYNKYGKRKDYSYIPGEHILSRKLIIDFNCDRRENRKELKKYYPEDKRFSSWENYSLPGFLWVSEFPGQGIFFKEDHFDQEPSFNSPEEMNSHIKTELGKFKPAQPAETIELTEIARGQPNLVSKINQFLGGN